MKMIKLVILFLIVILSFVSGVVLVVDSGA